jgi:transcriptional regulator with XRE-family HTH domain
MWHGARAVSNVPDVPPLPDEDSYLRLVGRSIEAFRKAKGLTQQELGTLCSVDKNTISRWENGKTSLSAFNLHLLTEHLDVDGDWLIRPADSITEVDARAAIVRRAAQEAARAAAEAASDPPGDDDGSARPGRGRPRRRPRSVQ